MGHYQEREVLFEDGSVVIFRRGDAWSDADKRIWQARLKIKGWKGYRFVSLKTRNKELAKQAAHQEWARLSQTVAAGGSLNNFTFENAWQKFSEDMTGRNRWSDARVKWHANYFNRYFKAYFGKKKLDELTDDFARGYADVILINKISGDFREQSLTTGETIENVQGSCQQGK